jgi:RNA polymerase sigma-70 factor (ECF subfamily)
MFARSRTAPDDPPECDFGAIYDQSLPRIYGYLVVRLGGDAATAEDLTQETFLSLARQLRQGRTPPDVLPWLIHVARNKLIDHYRRAERQRQRFTPWLDDDALPADPATPLAQVHDQDLIRAALAALPDSQRLAIALFYLDDLTLAQIADHLGKTPSAVESLLARGRANLRAALQSFEDTP